MMRFHSSTFTSFAIPKDFSDKRPLRFGHLLPNGMPCNHRHYPKPPQSEYFHKSTLQKTLRFFKMFFNNLRRPAHRHAPRPPRSIGQRIRDGLRYLIDWFKEAFRHIAEDVRSLLRGASSPAPADFYHQPGRHYQAHARHEHHHHAGCNHH